MCLGKQKTALTISCMLKTDILFNIHILFFYYLVWVCDGFVQTFDHVANYFNSVDWYSNIILVNEINGYDW